MKFFFIVLCHSCTIAYVFDKWQITSADFYFKIIIIGTQIINLLFQGVLVQISIPSELCFINGLSWFISKFSSIHSYEIITHTHAHTHIAYQDSTTLYSGHVFQLNNSNSCFAVAIPVYMHNVKADKHDQCCMATFLFFPLI